MKYIFLLFFWAVVTLSQGQGRKGFQFTATIDNDFLGNNNKDENYTGGAKLELLFPGIKSRWQPFFRFRDENALNIQRFAFGATAYTPQNLLASSVVTGDRPYASLMYFSAGNTSFSGRGRRIVQSDLTIGSMGEDGPGKAQAYIHRHHWFGSERPEPQGWNNQVGYKSAFILNYTARYQYLLFRNTKPSGNFKFLQAHWTGRADAGNYMLDLQTGLKFNLFNINSSILQENNPDTGPAVFGATGTASKRQVIRFNVFAEPHLRFAMFNATLEGLMFSDKSVYKIPKAEVNRFLFEINAGANLTIADVFYARYSFYGRSREFTGGKGFHTWGGLTFGFSPGRWNGDK